MMDFLSKLKAGLSDLDVMMQDYFNETFDDVKIAEKDGFVVDPRGETYVYSPARCACRLGSGC